VNRLLMNLGILDTGYSFLTNTTSARIIIIIALSGAGPDNNMVFYLASLQNIDYSIYEAARIDGASTSKIFWKITVPLLKPVILLTTIMSTNGTLQLFDESVNLTKGGPSNTTITMSHYIYDISFKYVPKFGYAAAMSYLILILVGTLAFIQMKVGDKRE
jgi:lactose/L-arabinose transport system permease protein